MHFGGDFYSSDFADYSLLATDSEEVIPRNYGWEEWGEENWPAD